MIDFSLLFFQEKKAHECLKKMLGDNGTPNIEFNAWVVWNPPRRSFSAGLPTPTNAFLWFDITPQNRANETLQTVSMKKDTFLKMVEYLKNVVDWL